MMPPTVFQIPPISRAGRIKLNALAASMTPAANPSAASWNLSDTLLTKKTGSAPNPVHNPARRLARHPAKTTFILEKSRE
jgi:hypothetical protein